MLGSDLHPKFGQRERERERATPIVDTNKYGTINSVGSSLFFYLHIIIRYLLILEIMPLAGH